MKAVEALKIFFSTEDKPVTSIELLAFARADKAGYETLSAEVLQVLDSEQAEEVAV